MTLSNPPAPGWRYAELDGTDTFTVSVADTWEDWDLSAIVPSTAKAVDIAGYCDTNGGYIGVRTKGSAQDRKLKEHDAGSNMVHLFACTLIGTGNCVQVRNKDTDTPFHLMGYWY